MKRSTDRILTTHVGSLIRPPELREFIRARQTGKPYDKAAYEACLSASVKEIVRQQAAALEPVRWVRWVGLGGVGRGEQLAAREDRWLHHAPMFCNNFLLSVPPLRSFPALSSHPPQCIPPPLAGMLTWA